jgi:hypothetical protein
MTTTTSDSAISETEDRLAILEPIGRLALLLDARLERARAGVHRYGLQRSHLALRRRANDPRCRRVRQRMAPSAGNLDAVHHLISCHVISLDGDQATCAANMQGTHVYADASGGPMWTVGGRHDYQLKRTPDGWRISGLTFTIQWATGNEHIATLAMAAGRS